jgi:hypothetical protein
MRMPMIGFLILSLSIAEAVLVAWLESIGPNLVAIGLSLIIPAVAVWLVKKLDPFEALDPWVEQHRGAVAIAGASAIVVALLPEFRALPGVPIISELLSVRLFLFFAGLVLVGRGTALLVRHRPTLALLAGGLLTAVPTLVLPLVASHRTPWGSSGLFPVAVIVGCFVVWFSWVRSGIMTTVAGGRPGAIAAVLAGTVLLVVAVVNFATRGGNILFGSWCLGNGGLALIMGLTALRQRRA